MPGIFWFAATIVTLLVIFYAYEAILYLLGVGERAERGYFWDWNRPK